jgi:hypothetical protein
MEFLHYKYTIVSILNPNLRSREFPKFTDCPSFEDFAIQRLSDFKEDFYTSKAISLATEVAVGRRVTPAQEDELPSYKGCRHISYTGIQYIKTEHGIEQHNVHILLSDI